MKCGDKQKSNHCLVDALKIRCNSWACEGIQEALKKEKEKKDV